MILALILFAGMQGQGQTPKPMVMKCATGEHYERIQGDKVCVVNEAANPEPMVQPAIQVEHVTFTYYENCKPDPRCKAGDGYACLSTCDKKEIKEKVWTCADPERVLLTTESGRKLCVRFEEGK